MDSPTVCAVMLTAGRPEFARRAVECFRRQTYPAKRLLIINTGPGPILEEETHDMAEPCFVGADALTIGELRNMAMGSTDYRPHNTRREADIIVHFDDDDYSHPNRIAEQVALLQSSGVDVVGYNECLFWREGRPCIRHGRVACEGCPDPHTHAEAWLYSNPNPCYALGTSLAYWRRTWERKPFTATSRGEDLQFITGLKCMGISANPIDDGPPMHPNEQPRMIARIHPSNTSTAYRGKTWDDELRQPKPMWRRVPEWDTYARKVMEA